MSDKDDETAFSSADDPNDLDVHSLQKEKKKLKKIVSDLKTENATLKNEITELKKQKELNILDAMRRPVPVTRRQSAPVGKRLSKRPSVPVTRRQSAPVGKRLSRRPSVPRRKSGVPRQNSRTASATAAASSVPRRKSGVQSSEQEEPPPEFDTEDSYDVGETTVNQEGNNGGRTRRNTRTRRRR